MGCDQGLRRRRITTNWRRRQACGATACSQTVSCDLPGLVPYRKNPAQEAQHFWCIKDFLVYDPYAGTGTTLKVAKSFGFDYLGSEISQEYCNIANTRISDYTNQTKLF